MRFSDAAGPLCACSKLSRPGREPVTGTNYSYSHVCSGVLEAGRESSRNGRLHLPVSPLGVADTNMLLIAFQNSKWG